MVSEITRRATYYNISGKQINTFINETLQINSICNRVDVGGDLTCRSVLSNVKKKNYINE